MLYDGIRNHDVKRKLCFKNLYTKLTTVWVKKQKTISDILSNRTGDNVHQNNILLVAV